MTKINRNELTKEQIKKAMACKDADELMAAAQTEGIDLTKEEVEAYMAEMADVELDEETLKKRRAVGVTTFTKIAGRLSANKLYPNLSGQRVVSGYFRSRGV